ncbi:MAG: family transporter protein, partial [Verrucomicrobiales bacterium]|nr:family transporter protein [Verrucomicrobiales bacterium]
MTFLPIVGRELRVASRRKATYWTRVIAAGFWILITGCFLIIQSVSKGSFGSMMTGHWLFLILSWLAFFYTSLCGLFLTSDTLSEEKREGTLGLLFLTDLRGFDIVLGKLAGTSLQAAYSLLAVFPIFAIPFLLGGVSGELFGKMLLLLINSLFLSLAIGIFVSSLSHDSQKAINGTLFLLAAVLGLPLLIDWFRAGWDDTRFSPFLALASPILSFSESMQNRFGYFWNNMAVAHSIAWLLLIAASICAPRTWQQKESAKVKKILFARFRPGAATQLKHLRTRLLEINPAFWLSAREQSQSFYFKLILLLASLVLGLIYCSGQKVTIEGLAGF